MVRRVSAKEARNNFSDLIGSVYYGKEPVIVEKQGRPFVVVISPDDYERFTRDWQADFGILDEIWAKNPDVNAEEIEAEVAREIAATRQEKRSRSRGQRA